MSKCVCACGARIDGREWQQRAEKAEAALQRVREVCSQTKGDNWDSYNQGYDDALDVVESALEGDSDDE